MTVLPYVSVDEMKTEIVLPKEADNISDEQLLSKILFVQEYIEKLTKQFFNLRELELIINGTGNQIIVMPVPIVEITKIEVKESGVFKEYSLSGFDIYNSIFPEDDRDYPKIQINSSASGLYLFPRGSKNIKVTGSFGYLNEDLETPKPIKAVTKMLVIQWLKDITNSKGNLRKGKEYYSQENQGREVRISESISYGNLTGDPEIDNILRLYMKSRLIVSSL